ncbi:class I SAM-dependent methyltransferase [Paenibacillus koleovorans]|uniref:class I SAM-dependent methyltransferase n=1 Tax=Paenibacillus koleovorans TaxID=121608 RepID=UPI000FD6C073|nr:class I SAM-dependent methyltransferase [Paenibacillus koleovorans]
MNSKERFSNRVDNYVKFRPSYPQEAISYLYDTVGFRPESVIADVGAGTGIFSALLLERGSAVVAVEPNVAMREAAVERLGGERYSGRYRAVEGAAETTGLPAASVDFIVCAQAFHWFERTATQAEFRRILKPGGRVALVWNSRLTEGSEFLSEYDRLLQQYGSDYNEVKHTNITVESLQGFFASGELQVERFPYSQKFDFEGLQGRLLSSSYCPTPGEPNYEPLMAELTALFDRTQEDGVVSFDYRTEVFWGNV